MRRRSSVAAIAVGLASLAVTGRGQEPIAGAPASTSAFLSFRDALRRALAANTGVQRARAEVGAASANRRMSLSFLFPRVQGAVGLIRNSEEVFLPAGPSPRLVLPLNDWSVRLTVQQPLFAGLRDLRALQQAQESVRSAEQGARAAEDRILLRTAADYIQAVGGDELVKVEKQSLTLARERLRQARDFFEAGETTSVDVLRAESAVKAAERRLTVARRDREVAAGQLRIDLNVDTDLEVAEPRLGFPARPDQAMLLQQAEQARAEVRQSKSALRIAELEVSRQKGSYLPTLSADAGYVWQKTAFPTDRYGYAALRLTVPVWQSGEIGARVALARERERQARLALGEQLLTVREDVRRALVDLDAATTSLGLAREQLKTAEAEYQQVADLYGSQEVTSLDVQSSETSLNEARRAVVVTRLARLLSQLGVYFAAGDLKSAVFKEEKP